MSKQKRAVVPNTLVLGKMEVVGSVQQILVKLSQPSSNNNLKLTIIAFLNFLPFCRNVGLLKGLLLSACSILSGKNFFRTGSSVH